MSKQSIRLAVFGTGFGAAIHLPVFQAMNDVDVVAIAGRRTDKTKQIADQSGIPHWGTNFEEILSLDLDAISVALPPNVSGHVIRMGQQRGLHILAEKPLARNYSESLDINSSPTDSVQMVGFQFCEIPAFLELKCLIQNSAFGPIEKVDAQWLVHSYAERHRLTNWKRNLLEGGGVLNLLGSHFFYNIEWLFGKISEIRPITIQTGKDASTDNFVPAEHTVTFEARLQSGAKLSAKISNATPDTSLHRIDITYGSGNLTLENTSTDYASGFHCRINHSQNIEKQSTISNETDRTDGRLAPFRSLASKFIAAIQNPNLRSKVGPTFRDDQRAQQLINDLCTQKTTSSSVATHAA